MKTLNLKTLVLTLFIAVSFISCNDDDTVPNKEVFITEVTGPAEITINENAVFKVSFKVESDCWTFKKFTELAEENTKTIGVTTTFSGSNCGANEVTKTQDYIFKTNTKGTYTFKFKKTEEEYITKTLEVN